MKHGFSLKTRLKDKVAIVTGSGQWIGRSIALRLAEEGCDVVIDDIDIAKANKVANEVRSLGRRALVVGADVTKSKQVNAMVKAALAEFGKIDILVNNVGRGLIRPFWESNEEEWDHTIAINLKSAMICSRAVISHMIERKKGRIISLSSGAGVRGCSGEADYCAAKAGIHGFTMGLSQEVASYGIRVNCIPVSTIGDDPSVPQVLSKKAILKRDRKLSGLPRQGTPEEVAALVAFLASDEADYINGQIFSMGGMNA